MEPGILSFIKNKKFVVTGATGFIGSHLIKKLSSSGAPEVIGIDINISNCDFHNSAVKILSRDISSAGALDDVLDKDTVLFHLAARANVPLSVKDPGGDFRATLAGYFESIESARCKKSAVIFPSTASIFDPSNPQPVSENSLIKPSSPYAAAKASGEAYSIAYHRCYGMDIKIARMFSVYGPGMKRFAIYDIINKIRKNHKEIEILGDGTQIRDYLYIDDVVDGLLLIAAKGTPGEDYNLGSGIPVKLMDLAKKIAALMGFPDIKINTTGRSFSGDVLRWYADIKKISLLGFAPSVTLEDGLKKTIKHILFL